MSTTPKRLSPERSRIIAIEAARDLLIEQGPQAVTLKAVAARIDRTHANLLHHFGSAAGLQRALIAHLADTITERIGEAAKRARSGEADPREVVDLTFDAFAQGGGAMASWMILSGNHDALDPVLSAIHQLVEDLSEGESEHGRRLREETFHLVLLAMGDALLGPAVAKALGAAPESARLVATRALIAARAAALAELTGD